MFNASGMHVLDVTRDDAGQLVVRVETDQALTGCPVCGVVAVGHGRRVHCAHDAPAFGSAVLVAWVKRIWRSPTPGARWARSPRPTP